jgi:hypothetical protein
MNTKEITQHLATMAVLCLFAMPAHGQGASKDVNGDGRTDASDIQLVVNASLGLPVDFNADINGDQRIDAADIQITIAIALGTTENLFPFGYSLKVFDQGTYGDLVGVGIFLVRGSLVRPNDPSPAAISFHLNFDASVFRPMIQRGRDVVAVRSEFLRSWYRKTIAAATPEPSVVAMSVSGGSTEMTTFDDQIASNPVETHNSTRQENPFLLGTIFLEKLPGATGRTEITFSDVAGAEASSTVIFDFGSEGGVFNLDASGL